MSVSLSEDSRSVMVNFPDTLFLNSKTWGTVINIVEISLNKFSDKKYLLATLHRAIHACIKDAINEGTAVYFN